MLAEQTTAAKREGEGLEKFAMAGRLAEWKKTIALTRGAEQLVRKVRNFLVFAPLSANDDGAAAAHRHPCSRQDPAAPGSNPAMKVFQTFQLFQFLGSLLLFQGVMEQSMVSNDCHE